MKLDVLSYFRTGNTVLLKLDVVEPDTLHLLMDLQKVGDAMPYSAVTKCIIQLEDVKK